MMSRLAAKDSYEKRPRYTRVEVRVGPIISEVTRIEVVDQTVEVEDNMEAIDLDKSIETITFKETLEGMEDKIIEKNTEIIGAMNITEVEIGQEKGHFQEAIVTIEIEVPVTVDQGQDLELVLIGTE